ncbi:MAG: four helix bundle protein [Candidatus Omnitrophota bacterium]|nr:four helix bundle protein [Candidatus Omnitrophota bacterium]
MSRPEYQYEPIAGFEKLWVWQRAHKLMLEMHEIVKRLPPSERFKLANQIERATSSVPDNIAEGYAAYYYNDKIKGMFTARKESAESQNHIEALVGKKYLLRTKADDWFNRYERVIAGINSFVNYIRDKRTKSNKKGSGKSSG